MLSIDNFNFEWFFPLQSGEQGHALPSTAEDSGHFPCHVRFRVDHDDRGHVCEIQHRDLDGVARALDRCPSQRAVVSCLSLHCFTFKTQELPSLPSDVQLSNFSYFVSHHGRAI